tara:strand:- start:933 stop:1109 length:177 start_codon:yes stop_codon:yes gene_type:complete
MAWFWPESHPPQMTGPSAINWAFGFQWSDIKEYPVRPCDLGIQLDEDVSETSFVSGEK